MLKKITDYKISRSYLYIIVAIILIGFVVFGIYIYLNSSSNSDKDNTDALTTGTKSFVSEDSRCSNYKDPSNIILEAANQGDLGLCNCIEEELFKEECVQKAKETYYEQQAIVQCDQSICEKIEDPGTQTSCISTVEDYVSGLDSEQLAICSAGNGDFDSAIESYEQRLSESRITGDLLGLAESYINKGIMEQEVERYRSEIFELIDEAEDNEPEYAEVYRVRGYAYEALNDFENSILNYDKAIEFNPDLASAYLWRGHSHRMLGNITEAQNDFQVALTLYTSQKDSQGIASSHRQICAISVVANNFNQGQQSCLAVISDSSASSIQHVEAYISLAEIHSNVGGKAKALSYLQQAEEINENNADLLYAFSKYYILDGDSINGLAYVEKLLSVDTNRAAGYWLQSLGLFGKESYDEAILQAEHGLEILDSDISLIGGAKETIRSNLYTVLIGLYEIKGDQDKVNYYKGLNK